MIIGYNESSLANSESYISYRDNPETPEDPVSRCKKLIEMAQHLTKENIEEAYVAIKQYSNSLSRAAVRAFENESIVLLYNNKPNLSMIQLIPFMTLRKGDRYITYIFMDQWIQNPRGSQEDTLRVNPGKLHDLLVGATIANSLKMDYSNLTNNSTLKTILMSLYCQFFCRILNREYGLGADKIVYDTVQYYVNRFFLTNIFGTPDDGSTDELAKKHFKYIDSMKSEEIKNQYNKNKPETVSDLITLIKELTPVMKKNLTRSLVVTNWMNYYKAPAYLAIDNIEYLIFMISAIKRGSDLVNARANDIVNETKDIKSFDAELLKLIPNNTKE